MIISAIKSNKVSEYFRQQGIEVHKQKKYHEALEFYNKALCYAKKSKSKETARAYDNRSAAYLSLEMPEKCLENIQLSRDAGKLTEKKELIRIREEKCLEMIDQKIVKEQDPGTAARNFFRLSYPACKKIPFLANRVELRESRKIGRKYYAIRDLKPGDVILLSKPSFYSIDETAVYKRCSNCLATNCLSLIPCTTCIGTMFCSKKCQKEAMKTFHKHECPSLDDFRDAASEDSVKSLPHMWRVFHQCKEAFGGIKKLKIACSAEKQEATLFDYDYNEQDESKLTINEFFAIFGHTTLMAERPKIYFDPELMNDKPLKGLWTCVSQRNDIRDMLNYMCSAPKIPLKEIVDCDPKKKEETPNLPYGHGFFMGREFFSHSCMPNIQMVEIGNLTAFIVQQNITKDELLSVSLCDDFYQKPKFQRQKELLDQHNIKCECDACLRDLPTFSELDVVDQEMHSKLCHETFNASLLSLDEATKEYDENCDYIQKNFKHFPCMEIAGLQKRNKSILQKVAKLAATRDGFFL